jgi:hypothetical protein
MSLQETLDAISSIKTELEKKAFQPMPEQQGQAQGGQPQGGGGGLLDALGQMGVDPNMLMQDPNMAQQVAQQLQIDPNQLMQMLQQEMQAMGGGQPQQAAPQQAAPQQAAPQEQAAGPAPEVQELYMGMEQMMQVVQQMQAENQQLRQQLVNVEGQMQAVAGQVDKVMSLIDETSGY